MTTFTWKKSTYSGDESDCVELACDEDARSVRDSKHPAGGALVFSGATVDAFLGSVKSGRFDG